MSRPRKNVRLRARGGIYYIIDGESRISTGFREGEQEADAQKALASYTEGQERGAISECPTIAEMMAAYCLSRTKRRRESVERNARNQALSAGQSRDVANKRAKEAGGKVLDAGTEQYIARHIATFIGSVETSTIANATARNYKKLRMAAKNHNRHQPVQESTVKRELNVLRAAINWAWAEDHDKWFPDRGSQPIFQMPVEDGRPRSKFLMPEQAQHLINSCTTPHVRLFLRIALATGARKAAIEYLRWENVNFERREIDFGQVDHKKRRPISRIPDDLLEEMKAAHAMRASEWVLEWRGRRAGDVKKSLERLGETCGFPWLTAHVLKHTKISWMVAEGIDYNRIADVTQTSVKMIRDQYSHLSPI